MKPETAKLAAKWWSDHLRGRAPLDNGDKSESGVITFMLASMLQSQKKGGITPEDIDRFEAELGNLLSEQPGKWIVVAVDYGPDLLLSQASERANIDIGITLLPWKTTMTIRDDKITVRCGYGAEAIELGTA